MNVLSINMSINNGDVERRYADFEALMMVNPPDLIAVQEVSSDVGQCALHGLAQRLGGDYTYAYETIYPGQEDQQGVAVITSLPLRKNHTMEVALGSNQAQVVEIGSRYNPIAVANVHLEASPRKEVLRKRKLSALALQLADRYRGNQQIIAGDFNALPFFPSIRMLKNRFGYSSAYAAVHGREPAFTFPALNTEDLLRGRYIKYEELVQLRRLADVFYVLKKLKPDIPRYTTDYVFLKNTPQPLTAKLINGKNGSSAPISDHFGLRVALPRLAA